MNLQGSFRVKLSLLFTLYRRLEESDIEITGQRCCTTLSCLSQVSFRGRDDILLPFSVRGRKKKIVLLDLSSAVRCREESGEMEARRRQRKKISIRLAASVPFSSSGAGNLPRDVTAEH